MLVGCTKYDILHLADSGTLIGIDSEECEEIRLFCMTEGGEYNQNTSDGSYNSEFVTCNCEWGDD